MLRRTKGKRARSPTRVSLSKRATVARGAWLSRTLINLPNEPPENREARRCTPAPPKSDATGITRGLDAHT